MKNFHTTIKSSNKLGIYDSHFLLKLSTLMESGFTMYNALIFLLEQYDVLKQNTKEEALRQIGNGEKLSDILKMLGFRKSIIIQVVFAEIHGEMINNLKESARSEERRVGKECRWRWRTGKWRKEMRKAEESVQKCAE